MITKGKIVWHFIKTFQLVLLRNVLEIWKLQCTYVCVWILGLKRSIFFSFLIVNFTPTADAILSDALFKSYFFEWDDSWPKEVQALIECVIKDFCSKTIHNYTVSRKSWVVF